MKKFLMAILILLTNTAAAQNNTPEIDEGISKIKQKKFDFCAESRFFTSEAAPEILFRYKNFSLDWIEHDDKDFFKLKLDREIFSLMGTGLEWNVALNAIDENSAVLPSVGLNFHMRIRPRLDIYAQFSGLPFGRYGQFSDFESGLKYFPQKNFSISTGWRSINFKRRDTFNLHGLFFGIRCDF